MKEMERFGIPINSFKNLIEEKNWYLELIWPKLKELEDHGPKWKTLIFKNPINSIRGVIEDNNLYLESIWPKFT